MMTDFLETLSKFPSLRIVVIGDLMLDHYIFGTTDRTSPEAPVPVVLVSGDTFLPGGAANVARNIAAAGCQVVCCGIVGTDEPGRLLTENLARAGVDVHSIIAKPVETIVKTRVVSQGQQIVRLDREKPVTFDEQESAAWLDSLGQTIQGAHGVIISDYGKGFLSVSLLNGIFAIGRKLDIPVFVDPKGRDYARYRGALAITPNSREAQEASGESTVSQTGLEKAATIINQATGCELVVITRGSEGLAMRTADGTMEYIPTSAREVFDVTGAGDTFVAWLTMGFSSGLEPYRAASLANIAAGISVGKTGPATVSPLELRQALVPGRLGRKIVNETDLEQLGDDLRSSGKRIVLANGCFDFLHAGHVAFMQQARALGDVLIVATNADETITKLKGASRPVITRKQREELLASIEAVDYVTVFCEDTPHSVIKVLRPDFLVKGSNYQVGQVEGADLVSGYGGQVRILPIEHDFHTDQLLGKHRP